jgi:hypothetical protein
VLNKQSKLTNEIIELLLEEHECTECRIIHPNEMVTTEYNEDRLNIYVNNNNEIVETTEG